MEDDEFEEPIVKNRRKTSPTRKDDNYSCQLMVNHSDNLLNYFHNLLKEKQMCDVQLVVGDEEHSAHRLVLCASSDVFQAMLMKPEWAEWRESRIELQELPECEGLFHLFLEYLYTGRIMITHTNVMPILALADKYIVKALSHVCISYMCHHVAHAASHNRLFSWLQYASCCWHEDLSTICQNYIKWNLQAIANTPDFGNFEADMLEQILSQNDVAVYNEMALFNCIIQWLDLQHTKLVEAAEGDHGKAAEKWNQLVLRMMRLIRFPMMTPRELANLFIYPLIKQHKDFFVDRMSMGMAYHAGRPISSDLEVPSPSLFTPRIYTSDVYSALLVVENVPQLPSYHTSTYVFSSHISTAEYKSDQIADWVVDLYPKGVWFRQCCLINWLATVEVPEYVLPTVRLSLNCRGDAVFEKQEKLRVKVSILIYGSQGGVEHIKEVIERTHQFNIIDRVLNIDDFIPFEDLNKNMLSQDGERLRSDCSVKTPYLVGPNRDQLKLNVVITAL